MSLIASLDMGAEKIVMAMAERDGCDSCRLTGIKMIVSQGVKDGVIVDKARVKSYIQQLIGKLAEGKQIDTLNVGLSGGAIRVKEWKVSVPVQRKVVDAGDLNRAENRCVEQFGSKESDSEVIDVIPLMYSLDGGDSVANPVGMRGRNLEVYYKVYVSKSAYIGELEKMITDLGIGEVNFFPETRAYMEALDVYRSKTPFALLDMGAMHTKVLLFNNGMLKEETVLPLGAKTIDRDIMSVEAFKIDDIQKAKKLKHDYGDTLRSACKAEKIDLPEVKLRIDKRDLAKVIQCRMEELLEGAVYQLQQWQFTQPENKILLTGGGTRIKSAEILLGKLSAHVVERATVKGIRSANTEITESPTCLTALGLLLCEHEGQTEETSRLGGWFSNIFK